MVAEREGRLCYQNVLSGFCAGEKSVGAVTQIPDCMTGYSALYDSGLIPELDYLGVAFCTFRVYYREWGVRGMSA